MKENDHIGSNFDDFLEEDGMLEEIEKVVAKRIFAFKMLSVKSSLRCDARGNLCDFEDIP